MLAWEMFQINNNMYQMVNFKIEKVSIRKFQIHSVKNPQKQEG